MEKQEPRSFEERIAVSLERTKSILMIISMMLGAMVGFAFASRVVPDSEYRRNSRKAEIAPELYLHIADLTVLDDAKINDHIRAALEDGFVTESEYGNLMGWLAWYRMSKQEEVPSRNCLEEERE